MSSERKIKIISDMGDLGFWVWLALMCVAFNGEPDLVDALIHFLMR